MPQEYQGMGLRVLYPDNWQLEDESTIGGDGVSFNSPQGAFLLVNRYATLESDAALERARLAMQVEYDEVESDTITRRIAGRDFSIVSQRFYYLDFVIASQLLSFVHDNHTYIVQIQGEDRDLDRLLPVCDAMLTSMLQNLSTNQ